MLFSILSSCSGVDPTTFQKPSHFHQSEFAKMPSKYQICLHFSSGTLVSFEHIITNNKKLQQYQRNNITCRPRWRCLSTELHPWLSHLRPGNVFFAGELDVHIILGQILPLVDQNFSSRQIKSERKIDIKSCQDKFFVESPLVFHYLNLFILFFFMGCNETW